MKYPKLRELKEAVRALIVGPYTSKFPKEAHTPYLRFRGKPEFHDEDCTGCGACFQVCPAGAIDLQDKANARTLTIHWDKCIACGQCQANCLTGKGIMLSNEFDLATTEKREDLQQSVEKEMVLCECCAEAVAPFRQYEWVANKLGPLCFSNASLLLFYFRNLNLAKKDIPPPRVKSEIRRADRIKILCPNCRRQAVLKS